LIRSDSIRSISGGGIEAMDENGDVLRLGSTEFVSAGTAVREDSHPELRNAISLADAQAASVVAFSVNSKPLTLFLLTESLRPGASQTIRQCLASGLPVSVLTGDRPARAEQLQRHLTSEISGNRNDAETCLSAEVSAAGSSAIACSTNGSQRFRPDHVAMLTVESSLKPDLKVRRVTEIRQQHGAVAMVGDGINDAPALAVSDIGIAMGCGADVSRDSAQVCLLSNDLTRIPWAIHLARQTRRVIRQNLFWAFGYNSAGVALAAFGLLNPAVAAGLMIVSSLLVISNSLRLMAESPEDSRTDRISEEQILSRTVASGTGGVQRIPTVDTLRAGGLA
jgi:cation transport ATPase